MFSLLCVRQPVSHHRQQLVNAYTLLHRAGVVHGDPGPRNWLVDPNGRISLVDFGQAFQTYQLDGDTSGVGPFNINGSDYDPDADRREWELACQREMFYVRDSSGAKFVNATV